MDRSAAGNGSADGPWYFWRVTTLALGPGWLDPDHLIKTLGLFGVLAIVFAESGLLIGFFLPGDSLLFTAGLLVATDRLGYPLWAVCLLVWIAAAIGDQAGYLFGRKVGPALFRRPDSRLFKQENVEKAHDFFAKHGPKSIVMARFVPIVRTFTPIIAGVSRMEYRIFVMYNIVGGLLWGCGVTLLGFWLGRVDFVTTHIELILVGIVALSVIPIVVEYLRGRARGRRAADESPAAAPSASPAEGRRAEGRSTDDRAGGGRHRAHRR
jgi:membrane-associated protein